MAIWQQFAWISIVCHLHVSPLWEDNRVYGEQYSSIWSCLATNRFSSPIVCHSPLSIISYCPLTSHCMSFPIVLYFPLSISANCPSFLTVCHFMFAIYQGSLFIDVYYSPVCHFSFSYLQLSMVYNFELSFIPHHTITANEAQMATWQQFAYFKNCCKRSFRILHRPLADIMWHHSQFLSSQLEKRIVTSHYVSKGSC